MGNHRYVVFFVGHNVGKECGDCGAYGTMTTEEFVEAQKTKLGNGGPDVLEEEESE